MADSIAEAGQMRGPILITGANNGIGFELAQTLISRKIDVIATDRNLDRIEGLRSIDSSLTLIRCELDNSAQVSQLCETIVASTSKLIGAVFAAGVTHEGLLHTFSPADWDYIFRTNVTSTFAIFRHLHPLFLAAECSSIVTIGSVSATLVGAGGGCAAYEASKAAVTQLTRAIAIEYADRGIRANIVAPGTIATNLGRTRDELIAANVLAPIPTERRPRNLKSRPISRPGRPDEVVSAILYLLDSINGFITGSTITVDGGYSII